MVLHWCIICVELGFSGVTLLFHGFVLRMVTKHEYVLSKNVPYKALRIDKDLWKGQIPSPQFYSEMGIGEV